MELDKTRKALECEGPFASVYVDAAHDTEDAAQQQELRCRAATEELAHQGAAEPLVAAVRMVLSRPAPHGCATAEGAHRTRAVIAAGERVLFDEVIGYGLARPLVRHSSAPYLVPLLHDSCPDRPYVSVRVDREGADITAYAPNGKVLVDESVGGTHRPVHPVRSGGNAPSGRAFHDTQAVAAEAIRRNVEDYTEEVVRVFDAVGAGALFVIGEMQTRSALVATLPERVAAAAGEIGTGSRAPSDDDEAVAEEQRRRLLGARLEQMQQLDDALHAGEATGPPVAVQGLDAVCAALREHNVDTLLVTEPTDTTVFVGGDRTQVAVHSTDLVEEGAAAVECRADEALPCAALAQSGDLVWIDQRLDADQGFGALLRHA